MKVFNWLRMRRFRRSPHIRGFTLVELMVVMVILALLAGGVTVLVVRRVSHARSDRARVDIENLSNALEQYKLDNQDYPTTEQGLEALVRKPSTSPEPAGWLGRYIKELPKDPWGSPFYYECPGRHNEDGFDVWTFGKDRQEGGQGDNADVANWTVDRGS